ncbi:MAG: hypothetical protein EBT34_11150 [Acetobacteraceae bacterium]|nr:hypothetical protein [Acetobacteraceae bacterium]
MISLNPARNAASAAPGASAQSSATVKGAPGNMDRAVEMRRAATPPMEGDMVPKAAVAALASRLDETIARLRSNLDEAV